MVVSIVVDDPPVLEKVRFAIAWANVAITEVDAGARNGGDVQLGNSCMSI